MLKFIFIKCTIKIVLDFTVWLKLWLDTLLTEQIKNKLSPSWWTDAREDETPLVMIHGMGAGLGFFSLNFDKLVKDRTVYAIDLPGKLERKLNLHNLIIYFSSFSLIIRFHNPGMFWIDR